MKKFIALAVLASSTVSFAASSDIYDIQYLPSPGTTYGFTTAQMVDQTIEFDGGREDEMSGNIYTQTIGHAFTDRLSVQASINYSELEYDPDVSGISEFDYSNGISDPTLSVRFRTMDEKFRWDIIGGATLSLGDKEIKSDLDTNNTQGGHGLFIGTQFGVKTESMQWAVLGQLTHNLEATIDDKAADEKFDADASNELLVRGDILNKLAEKTFFRSHLSVNFTEDIDNDSDSGASIVEVTSAPSTMWELGTEFQYLCSQNILGRIGVDYQMTSQDTANQEDNKAWVFTIGANYQF